MEKINPTYPKENSFGKMPDGHEIFLYELVNSKGLSVSLINYGATITSIKIPLKINKTIDVVLGFDNLDAYIKSFDLDSAPYIGATVGRYAGRIKNASFLLNNQTIKLNSGNPHCSLHGGINGFSKKIWQVKAIHNGLNPSITFTHFSEHGEEGFPGGLMTTLKYTLTEENEIWMDYNATTTDDTIINLTHHSYFNLDGHQSNVLNQDLRINAHQMLETTEENIPTGRFLELSNTAFDYLTERKCPKKIDNTFVLNNKNEVAATLYSSKNHLKLSVFTDQPAVHIYIGGNCFHRIKGKENTDYHTTSGICFETQNFPDAPNHAHFPNAFLKKGDVYHQKTIYKFEF